MKLNVKQCVSGKAVELHVSAYFFYFVTCSKVLR